MKKIVLSTVMLSMLMVTSINAVEVSKEQEIMGLYVSFFKRAADKSGFDFWKAKSNEAIDREEDTSDVLKELSKGFAEHELFTSVYSNLNNRAFVEAIYQNTLSKAGDSEGINQWTNLLDGGMSRSDLVANFVQSALSVDLTKENFPTLTEEALGEARRRQDFFTNRVDAGIAFSRYLGVLTNFSDTSNIEDDPAYIASMKIIQGVTEYDVTYSEAVEYLAYIQNEDDAISKINNELKWLKDIRLSADESVICTGVTPFTVKQTNNPVLTFITNDVNKEVTITSSSSSNDVTMIENCTLKDI